MPVSPTYPGVYIEEVPSSVRTIIGVSTGTTAFVGPAPQGPGEASLVTNWEQYGQLFGGLSPSSKMSYGVQQFFLNGGQLAVIIRVWGKNAKTSTLVLGSLTLQVSSPGTWGDSIRARVDVDRTRARTPEEEKANVAIYNLTIRDTKSNRQEEFRNISTDASSPQSLTKLLSSSKLVTVDPATVPATPPSSHAVPGPGVDPWTNDKYSTKASGGADDDPLGSDYVPTSPGPDPKGIDKLRHVDIFNILCVPDLPSALLPNCLQLCAEYRAMLIVDPPPDWTLQKALDDTMKKPLTGATENAALFFPWPQAPDPDVSGNLLDIAPSGAVAGVWARTDVRRGVWKAGAGLDDGRLAGISDLKVQLTDPQIGQLNPIGVNCLKKLPIVGSVVWGARTMAGADYLASQWKYVPVRRLALYIEQSLFRSTNWVVFEPNDEPLWSSIRLNVGVFMHGLFRQGAFQGSTPKDAYLVKCDAENNPQEDIDRGIVNILVGFAPLKPAEFVIIQIKQQSPLMTAT